ncbi:uncharacterized protein PHALS_15115 [Plasmopara halstedii]|uniref:Uncharacterized protein n=1 Tax=Plasmopara halstedii TaxID=4781 RepID=A0A0P1B8J6_PLAHL|nr:uncharacterized protein PHALS_15115 [Plasmopara halstedii]CEG50495.1 hypothetical protein PHALS_15115 [Plasmopara halstedii]|eukprot:XP_024586864.1 hypothetical protein PHALS_15115 [Plasmopara halstedii]
MIHFVRDHRGHHEVTPSFHRQIKGLKLSLWLVGFILVFDVCFADGKEIFFPLLQFFGSYPDRFMVYYKPKITALVAQAYYAFKKIDDSEQVTAAWNFTVALVTLVCVHHVADTIRKSVASRLRTVVALESNL